MSSTPHAPTAGNRARRWVVLLVLAVAAAYWNARAPTIFFDIQVMLGGSLAVLAVLQFGWPGVLVGACALTVTAVRWGHPYELIVGTGLLVWLKIFLDHFNGCPANRDNGRVVLAGIAYWLVVGLPLELLFFTKFLGADFLRAFALGMKEAVTGTINTAIGLFLFIAVRLWKTRGRRGVLSARGLVFSVVLLAITVPGILITLVLSEQLKAAFLEEHLDRMRQFGKLAELHLSAPQTDGRHPGRGEGMEFQWRGPGGAEASSNAGLFSKLDECFVPEVPSRTGMRGLDILKPKNNAPVPVAELDSYWVTAVPERGGELRVVQPAPELIRKLAYELLLPAVILLMMLLIFGAAASEFLGRLVGRQFDSVIGPLREGGDFLPDLGPSKLKELDSMVELINERGRRVNELTASLDRARQKEKAMEEEQRRALERKLKTSLTASVVAHEINQPLSAILLQGRSILSDPAVAEALDPDLAAALRDIIGESDRVVETIKKMKSLLRNVETKHELIDLADVLRSAMKYCEPLASRGGVALACRGDEEPRAFTGDAGQLMIALTNIIRNAIEAAGKDRAHGQAEVLVRLQAAVGAVEFVVEDNGPGLSVTEMEHLLLNSTKPEGSGLGLYIARAALENHGGRLEVGRSALGGAEFRLVLPRPAPAV